jgi:hypothetical protein
MIYVYDDAREKLIKNHITATIDGRRIVVNGALSERYTEIYDGDTLNTIMEIHYDDPNRLIIYDDWVKGKCEKVDFIVKEAQDIL